MERILQRFRLSKKNQKFRNQKNKATKKLKNRGAETWERKTTSQSEKDLQPKRCEKSKAAKKFKNTKTIDSASPPSPPRSMLKTVVSMWKRDTPSTLILGEKGGAVANILWQKQLRALQYFFHPQYPRGLSVGIGKATCQKQLQHWTWGWGRVLLRGCNIFCLLLTNMSISIWKWERIQLRGCDVFLYLVTHAGTHAQSKICSRTCSNNCDPARHFPPRLSRDVDRIPTQSSNAPVQ